ncbi:MAG: hypothetical protein AAFU57_12200 [Bacteroidota bacterium]
MIQQARKIKAGALQFVLFIGALVAVLLFAFVLISHVHAKFRKKSEIFVDLIRANDAALFQSLQVDSNAQSDILFTETTKEGRQTEVVRQPWGIFEIRKANVTHGKLSYSKIGLVGRQNSQRPALYLKDRQRPLVVAGSAKIIGDAFLPERGVKTGNIAGNGYAYQNLVFGKQKRSTEALPKLADFQKKTFYELSEGNVPTLNSSNLVQELKSLSNSFSRPLQVIDGTQLILEGIQLSGYIMIRASKSIVVKPTAKLEDVVLMAPEITIASGTTGNFQAFASKNIAVGQNCSLTYPTVLALVDKKPKETQELDQSSIQIGKNSIVRGLACYLEKHSAKMPLFPNISIAENAIVMGEIYNQGALELKGTVEGSVSTTSFIAMEQGAIYQNHLYDGQINIKALPNSYTGLLYTNESPNSIMKWLY